MLGKVGDTSIKVDAHRTLNYSKGVLKCKDPMFSSSEEIVRELRSQGVVACKNIAVYISNPLTCFNCQKFAHAQNSCKGQKVCVHCSTAGHDAKDFPTS